MVYAMPKARFGGGDMLCGLAACSWQDPTRPDTDPVGGGGVFLPPGEQHPQAQVETDGISAKWTRSESPGREGSETTPEFINTGTMPSNGICTVSRNQLFALPIYQGIDYFMSGNDTHFSSSHQQSLDIPCPELGDRWA